MMREKHRFKKEREFKKRLSETEENEEGDIRSFKFHRHELPTTESKRPRRRDNDYDDDKRKGGFDRKGGKGGFDRKGGKGGFDRKGKGGFDRKGKKGGFKRNNDIDDNEFDSYDD